MSDFARFVAAALRDRTVQELIDENNRLREEKRLEKEGRSKLVITVCEKEIGYEALVTRDGKRFREERKDVWRVSLPCCCMLDISNEDGVSWSDLSKNMQFFLGGVLLRDTSTNRILPEHIHVTWRDSEFWCDLQNGGALICLGGRLKALPKQDRPYDYLQLFEKDFEEPLLIIDRVYFRTSFIANLVLDKNEWEALKSPDFLVPEEEADYRDRNKSRNTSETR